MATAIEGPHEPLRDALVEDHDRIERLLDRILLDDTGENSRQTERWIECASLVVAHLDIEDTLLFPTFELTRPGFGLALRSDHARIRAHCAEISAAFEQQAQRVTDIRALSRLLRAHHRREAMAMREWAKREE